MIDPKQIAELRKGETAMENVSKVRPHLLHVMEGAGMTNKNLGRLLIGAWGILGVASLEVKAAEETSSFEIYGFAQADWIQDSKRVDPNWTDAFRPSKIGVDSRAGRQPLRRQR